MRKPKQMLTNKQRTEIANSQRNSNIKYFRIGLSQHKKKLSKREMKGSSRHHRRTHRHQAKIAKVHAVKMMILLKSWTPVYEKRIWLMPKQSINLQGFNTSRNPWGRQQFRKRYRFKMRAKQEKVQNTLTLKVMTAPSILSELIQTQSKKRK